MKFISRLFNKAPSRDAFAKRALAAMRRLGEPNPVYDSAAFKVTTPGGATYDLGNVFRLYADAPASEREGLIEHWLTSLRFTGTPDTFDDVREMLLPMVRARAEALLFGGREPGAPVPVERPFSEDLVLAVVIDWPTSVKRVRDVDLAQWNIDEETAYRTALHNLRLKSADAWQRVAPGVYVADWHDAFDVTRSVFPDLVRRAPIEGEPVIMTPNRDCLLVAGARDPDALRAMVSLAIEEYDDRAYALTMQPLALRGDTWEPFDVGGEAMRQVRRRLLGSRAEDYQLQANTFAGGGEFFYAPLQHDVREGRDEFATTAAWPHDKPAMLPKADTIAVWRNADECARVAWDDVARIVGGLEPEPDLWPPRYRVAGPPTDAQYAALRDAGELDVGNG
jgi:hypothetical protein